MLCSGFTLAQIEQPVGGISVPKELIKTEESTNLYIIMYISSGITLASMVLAYNIFNRSSISLDKVGDNIIKLTECAAKTLQAVESNGRQIASTTNKMDIRPCLLETKSFWRGMEDRFDVKQRDKKE